MQYDIYRLNMTKSIADSKSKVYKVSKLKVLDVWHARSLPT